MRCRSWFSRPLFADWSLVSALRRRSCSCGQVLCVSAAARRWLGCAAHLAPCRPGGAATGCSGSRRRLGGSQRQSAVDSAAPRRLRSSAAPQLGGSVARLLGGSSARLLGGLAAQWLAGSAARWLGSSAARRLGGSVFFCGSARASCARARDSRVVLCTHAPRPASTAAPWMCVLLSRGCGAVVLFCSFACAAPRLLALRVDFGLS